MYAKFLKTKGTWRDVADSARTTINKEAGTKEPSSSWKRRMLLAEHSPIRRLSFSAKWYDLKYWVSVHIVRHKFGIDHWIRTQRTDRTGIDRNEIPQGALVEHEIEFNAQSAINISRKRLCKQASLETTEAWKAVLDSVSDTEPELVECCVPECIYRGFCPEYISCGYHKTDKFKQKLVKYRKGINE